MVSLVRVLCGVVPQRQEKQFFKLVIGLSKLVQMQSLICNVTVSAITAMTARKALFATVMLSSSSKFFLRPPFSVIFLLSCEVQIVPHFISHRTVLLEKCKWEIQNFFIVNKPELPLYKP
jgi:hypothetical protein